MTEYTYAIETVTVTFEEFKSNLDHYLSLKENKRVAVIRDGEEVAMLGPWLPGETRPVTPQWVRFFKDLFPPEPVDHECRVSRALDETREEGTFT